MNADQGRNKPQRNRPRVVTAMPNGFTLANLFFGIFAIVASTRGEFDDAALYIVFAAVFDTLDGRIARATKTGSAFGEQLDSLVDAISFGTAPALIMYFAVLNKTGWDWIFCFIYTSCAVIRLARFNVEQAGTGSKQFTGLPSPAAGLTLATYYWFSQTDLYTETMIGNLPWHQTMRFVMLGLAGLMISNVQYAKVPTVGFKSIKGILGTLLVVGVFAGVIFLPKPFFFPAWMCYVAYGIGRTVLLGLMDRVSFRDDDNDDDDDDYDDDEVGDGHIASNAAVATRQRRRRRRTNRPNPGRPADLQDPPA
ncbi:MAG: CDP-diacylglycerol--serine O-phosphatidyltransferase [Gemmatimonadaceae bacterium]